MTNDSSILLLSGDQLQLQRSIDTHVQLTSLRLPGIDPTGYGYVSACGLSPGGNMLAVGYRHGTVLLWDCEACLGLHTLQLHKGRINCCSFSATGDMLVVGDAGGMISVWQVQWGMLLQHIRWGVSSDIENADTAFDNIEFTCRVHDGSITSTSIYPDVNGCLYVFSYDNGNMVITELDTYAQDLLVKGLWESHVRAPVSFCDNLQDLVGWAGNKAFTGWASNRATEVADGLRPHLVQGLIQVGHHAPLPALMAQPEAGRQQALQAVVHSSARRSRHRCSACCTASCMTAMPHQWRRCCSCSRTRAGRRSSARWSARRPGAYCNTVPKTLPCC